MECVICYEDYSISQPYTLECGHMFHLDCAWRAVEITGKCPLCRHTINKVALSIARRARQGEVVPERQIVVNIEEIKSEFDLMFANSIQPDENYRQQWTNRVYQVYRSICPAKDFRHPETRREICRGIAIRSEESMESKNALKTSYYSLVNQLLSFHNPSFCEKFSLVFGYFIFFSIVLFGSAFFWAVVVWGFDKSNNYWTVFMYTIIVLTLSLCLFVHKLTAKNRGLSANEYLNALVRCSAAGIN